MNLDDLLRHKGEWLKGTGPYSEIVISSRIRLARNLAKIPFSHWASKKQTEEVINITKPVIMASPLMKDPLFIKMYDIDSLDRQFLLERHLISREHTTNPDNKALTLSEGEVMSIMINEEDHLRMQILQSGFNLKRCWELMDELDTELGEKINFAFSPEWGYLTACPTNTGTGLRASVMLHLPSLVMTKQIDKVLQAITKIGLTARGFYGEGTQAVGNFFQISNQVTLGQSELDLIGNIERIITQIITHEENARNTLLLKGKEDLQDKVFRAYGILTGAHIITSKETVELLSVFRLGVDLGIITNIKRDVINELLIIVQPAHLQKLHGKNLTAKERDVKRAELIREKLKV